MESRTQDRVEEWDARSFSGGFDGLRDLANDEFTGAVESAGRWLFMLNGRIVGVFDGDLDDFEDASGTTYGAPDPALVMLCTMWETGGQTKAKYYTNDTPISEVDDTLTAGSFTGYLELSENVLSGDYYVCYYGGRSLPVAWVGNSEQLLTADDAFERADDEVGIYEVRDVDLEVVELPEPDPEPEPDDGAGGAAAAGAGAGDEAERDPTSSGSAARESADETNAAEPSRGGGDAGATGDSPSAQDEGATALGPGDGAEAGAGEASARADEAPTGGADANPSGRSESAPDRSTRTGDRTQATNGDPTTGDEVVGDRGGTGAIRGDEDPTSDDDLDATPEDVVAAPPADDDGGSAATGGAGERTTGDRTRRDRPTGEPAAGPNGTRNRSDERGRGRDRNDPLSESGDAVDSSDPRFEREAEWRETTTIPSIDPDQSAEADETHAPAGSGSREGGDRRRDAEGGPAAGGNNHSEGTAGRGSSGRNAAGTGAAGAAAGGSEPLEREMLEREDKIDRLQQRVSNLESERDQLRAKCERLRSEAEGSADVEALEEERDRLQSENEQLRERAEGLEREVESLESDIERLESALEEARAAVPEDDADAARELSPAAALSGTNLFVRYASKGEDTLADAHSGTAPRGDVNDNLRLEHHTSFDADDVAVGDVAYGQFLRESIEFGFVDWVVRTLLFEIRETGNQDQLHDLYDTLPEVDRAELDGTVELETGDDEETPAEINFDVVLRNRMGAPLVVANVNDSREPATKGMMVQLNEDAGAVKERHEAFVGAFMVTTSFFEPGALETADEATSGSFLSRDSRKSFVKLSRKRGYHLCLVETRDGNFHVNVPEL
jgi:outer membrane murein-binding lipoprotein Lpp